MRGGTYIRSFHDLAFWNVVKNKGASMHHRHLVDLPAIQIWFRNHNYIQVCVSKLQLKPI